MMPQKLKLQRYNSKHGSGVTHYANGKDFIVAKFKEKSVGYKYTYKLNGRHNIEAMKKLARANSGLNTCISRHPEIRNKFEVVAEDMLDFE
jgi:hypothetical protein